MSGISYQKDHDSIVTLLIDAPDDPVNTLNAAFQKDLSEALDRLEAERDDLAGVIITSAKATFFAGGDLRALITVTPATAAPFFAEIEAIKANLRRLEKLGRPVVAAINGSALGGGLELALACHRRICLDSPKVQIGFPEVTLGLLPGCGGVVRSVRMLGLQTALPYLMEGKRLNPAEALAAGFIDSLAIDAPDMMSQARAWIAATPVAVQAWDVPKARIPGGSPSSPAVAAMLPVAAAMLAQKIHGNYPAPAAILAAAVEGAQVDFDTALRVESRYMTRVASGQVAKNMIGAFFFQLNEIKAGAGRPPLIERSKVTKVGIAGAGMMGAGIAWACASRGVNCLLADTSIDRAEHGKQYSENLLSKRLAKGKSNPDKVSATLARITPTADFAGFADCQLVIEAVFENRELKAQIIAAVESAMPANAVLASNTSTLPITGLAMSSKRPGQFIGLHFFSPVDRMQLVEIIKGKQTSEQTLAQAYDFVLQIGKIPIVVNDARGFYTSRVFGTYVNEGMALLGEGVPAALIENIGEQAGMPTGPLAVLDEVSLKLADDVLHQELADLARERAPAAGSDSEQGSEVVPPAGGANRRVPPAAIAVLEKMVHEFQRSGRAHGAGFYEYPADARKSLWKGLEVFVSEEQSVTTADVHDRLLYAQAVETLRCLQEGVVESHRDANIGSIFGWGFPAWTGGTVQFVNHVGVRRFVARANELAKLYGERFAPPDWVLKRAEQDLEL